MRAAAFEVTAPCTHAVPIASALTRAKWNVYYQHMQLLSFSSSTCVHIFNSRFDIVTCDSDSAMPFQAHHKNKPLQHILDGLDMFIRALHWFGASIVVVC
jgi:hypothetical protein